MAFAKRKTGGGESFPLLKWDGRVGRLYTQDREQQKNGEWQSVVRCRVRYRRHRARLYEVPEGGGTGDGHGPDGRRHR
jgi:hypothetical protein